MSAVPPGGGGDGDVPVPGSRPNTPVAGGRGPLDLRSSDLHLLGCLYTWPGGLHPGSDLGASSS